MVSGKGMLWIGRDVSIVYMYRLYRCIDTPQCIAVYRGVSRCIATRGAGQCSADVSGYIIHRRLHALGVFDTGCSPIQYINSRKGSLEPTKVCMHWCSCSEKSLGERLVAEDHVSKLLDGCPVTPSACCIRLLLYRRATLWTALIDPHDAKAIALRGPGHSTWFQLSGIGLPGRDKSY